jgi:exodeoxyribonuclease V alpha subunit
MVFLHNHGVGTARAVRIFKTYGADAVQVMSQNPYRLARDIRGIGFKTADAIAMKLGIEKTAMIRVRAGISYALTEAMDERLRGLQTEDLVPLAESLLEVPAELVRTALDLELAEGAVIADRVGETPCTFLAGLYRAERAIAERLLRLALGLALAESQTAAIKLALVSRCWSLPAVPALARPRSSRAFCAFSQPRGWGCCYAPPPAALQNA